MIHFVPLICGRDCEINYAYRVLLLFGARLYRAFTVFIHRVCLIADCSKLWPDPELESLVEKMNALLPLSGVCYDPSAAPPDEPEPVLSGTSPASSLAVASPLPRPDPRAAVAEHEHTSSSPSRALPQKSYCCSDATSGSSADVDAVAVVREPLPPVAAPEAAGTGATDAPSSEKRARRDSEREAGADAGVGDEQNGYDQRPPALPTVIEPVKYFECATAPFNHFSVVIPFAPRLSLNPVTYIILYTLYSHSNRNLGKNILEIK